jgi:uncharacterized protein (DUF2267 family)
MLPKSVIKDIRNEVDDVYDRIKARFLNEKYKKKGIEFTFRNDTLEDFFRDIAEREGVEPDKDTLATLKEVAGSYLDASRERAKAQVIQAVQAVIRESVLSGETPNVRVAIQGQMSKIWGDATTHVNTILESEVNTAKNVSILEGITKYNASVGVDDPVVFFIIVRDGVVCSECVRLHMMPDGVTPRLWYMSEVGSGYHKKGDPNPKLSGLHPSCRCQLSTLLLSYGFNASGKVTYVAKDHSEIDKQRGMTKSELLGKSTRETLTSGLWDAVQSHVEQKSGLGRINDPDDQNSLNFSQIAINVPKTALAGILKDGRIKNMFESKRSGGMVSENIRKQVEMDMFGIHPDIKPDQRPVYGALQDKTNWMWHRGPSSEYGSFWFDLKPHVKERSTFSAGDTVEMHSRGETDGVYINRYAHKHMNPEAGDYGYHEAQIHGGVYLDKDVNALHFAKEAQKQTVSPTEMNILLAIGKKYRIPVLFHRSNQHGGYLSTETLYDPSTETKED